MNNPESILHQYRITHNNEYTFAHPAKIGVIATRLSPRTCHYQQVDFSQIVINPPISRSTKSIDQYGNIIFQYELNRKFQRLNIAANHVVTAFARKSIDFNAAPSWKPYTADTITQSRLQTFMGTSDYVSINSDFKNYANKIFREDYSILKNTELLIKQIYSDFTYAPNASNVNTPAIEAFHSRRGVCQDFSHIAISCLRSLGIAARYVSGYIDTKIDSEKRYPIGCDASHAWISVYDPQYAWIDFDPTNNKIVDKNYIEIGYGRDYNDLAPLTGYTNSMGKHRLTVAVEITKIN